jgi:hypothetical protein
MISRLVLLGTVLVIGARDIRAQSVPLISADFDVETLRALRGCRKVRVLQHAV